MLGTNSETPAAIAPSWRTRLGRIAIVIVVAISAGIWLYVFSGQASRVAPDVLGDPSYRALAEPTCAGAVTALEAVPDASEADDKLERAEQVRVANAILADMVAELTDHLDAPSVVLNERDRGITEEWLADWRTYLDARRDLAERLAADGDAPLFVPAIGGERLDVRITRFANVNFMQSCVTPGDVR